VLGALRSSLDSWRGIGAVERGMARQGYDLQLTRYDARGWRATFYPTGIEHSITSATASTFAPTPWRSLALTLGALSFRVQPAGGLDGARPGRRRRAIYELHSHRDEVDLRRTVATALGLYVEWRRQH
jgi:hypothetical protein